MTHLPACTPAGQQRTTKASAAAHLMNNNTIKTCDQQQPALTFVAASKVFRTSLLKGMLSVVLTGLRFCPDID